MFLLFALLRWTGCQPHVGSETSSSDFVGRHSLALRTKSRSEASAQHAVQARRMPSGYNCKAYVWIGRTDFYVLAAFDTGAAMGQG